MGEDRKPVGRPNKYDPAFCEKVIELGKIGASKVEMACELGICKATFNNYENEYPEFLDAVRLAVMFSQVFWEKTDGWQRLERFLTSTRQLGFST